MPEIGMILREGKGKKVYATDDPDKAIVYFKDEAMAFHGLKRGRILGKGEVNNAVCEHLFSLLDANGFSDTGTALDTIGVERVVYGRKKQQNES